VPGKTQLQVEDYLQR